MGYAVERFEDVNEEVFICKICTNVLKSPKMIKRCEHIFCGDCLDTLSITTRSDGIETAICPLDDEEFLVATIQEPVKFFLTWHGTLVVRCEFCDLSLELKDLPQHELECESKPGNIVVCQKVCGATLKSCDVDTHNCGQYLRSEFQTFKELIKDNEEKYAQRFQSLDSTVRDLKNIMDELSQELKSLRTTPTSAQTPPSKGISKLKKTAADSSSKSIDCIENSQIFSTLKSKVDTILAFDSESFANSSSSTSWHDHLAYRLICTLTKNTKILDIIQSTDLRCFYHSPSFCRKLFHDSELNQQKLMFALQITFLEWIDNHFPSSRRILWIAPVEYGFGPILAQLYKHSAIASDALNAPLYNQHFPAVNHSDYLVLRANMFTIPLLHPDGNRFDAVVSFANYTFMDCKTVLERFGTDARMLAYNAFRPQIEFGRLEWDLVQNKSLYVYDILASGDSLATITREKWILQMNAKYPLFNRKFE